MMYLLKDNIYSPLGFGSEENFRAALSGRSGLKLRTGVFGVPEPFVASLFERESVDERFAQSPYGAIEGYSLLEKAMILSVADTLSGSGVDASDGRVLFVVSTTKGNVELLEQGVECTDERLGLWHTAAKVAEAFGNPNRAVVVSNACTSGLCALIVAERALCEGKYDHVVVVGGDVLSKFIVSGFQSFKALSPEVCRPFDASRRGLNLGEGVASILCGKEPREGSVRLLAGAIRNDANHISGPSRTAEGLYAALQRVMNGVDSERIAFVNAHGTATRYNDDMEAVAVNRAGLQHKPLFCLKPAFGHTLGAAGVLEAVVSCRALREGVTMPMTNYHESGVESGVRIEREPTRVSGDCFAKIISGFGGTNAAAIFELL